MSLSLYQLSVFLHILAATIWIGGMAFLVLVVVPLLRRPGTRESAAAFIHRSGLRFRAVGWACLVTLVVTGTFNMRFRGLTWADFFSGRMWQQPFSRPLFVKLLLVALVLVLSAVHDFGVGPRATELWQARPDAPETLRLRRLAGFIGRVNALLALAILYCAVALVRGGFP